MNQINSDCLNLIKSRFYFSYFLRHIMESKFEILGLHSDVLKNALKNKNLTSRLEMIMKYANLITCTKQLGSLLYNLAAKMPQGFEHRLEIITNYIINTKISNQVQLEAAINYIKKIGDAEINVSQFEKECGVGIIVTDEEIKTVVEASFEASKKEIQEK